MTFQRVYGLIGYPVAHSLSPAMHNAAFAHLKINAEYKLFPLKEDEVGPFLRELKKNDIYGLNVTVPYKEKVIPFLNSISDEAGLIGAVNTIKLDKDKLLGFNTDAEGFLRHLNTDLKFNPKSKTIAIIGAGGASRALSVYLAKGKPRSIFLYDTQKDKLSALLNHLRENFKSVEIKAVSSIPELDIQNCDLLVNATPIGMKETDPCLVPQELLHQGLLVYDLIYNPKETKLLKRARLKGIRTSNGLGMLLYQGMLSFEIWTNQKPPQAIMQRALEGGLAC